MAPDLQLEIPFLDAISGTDRELRVPASIPCYSCKTNMAKASVQQASTPVLCHFCKGSGYTVKVSGTNRIDVSCKMCKGTRYTHRCQCADCGDRGTITVDEPVHVHVPPGTADKDVLKAKHPVTGRPLRVHVHITDSEQFRRRGYDVHSDVHVPFTMAILGGPLSVAGVYGGESHVKIPAGTQSDTQIRLVGKGIRKDHQMQGHGDHVLVVKIRVPQHLSDRQKTLLTAFSTIENATLDTAAVSRNHPPMTEASMMSRRSASRCAIRAPLTEAYGSKT